MLQPTSNRSRRTQANTDLRLYNVSAFAASLFFAMALMFVLGIGLYEIGVYSARTLVIVQAGEITVTAIWSIVVGRVLGYRLTMFEPPIVLNLVFVLYYTVRPIYLMEFDDAPHVYSFPSNNPASALDYAWAVGYAVVGLALFHLGYYLMKCRVRRLSQQNKHLICWDSGRVTQVVVVGGLWATASATVGILAAGGISGTLANIGRLRDSTAGYGYALLGTSFFAIGAVLLFADHLLGRPRMTWVVCFSFLSVMYCGLTGNRTGIFALVLALVVTYAYIRGVQSYVRLVLWFAVICLVLVPFTVMLASVREKNTGVADVVPIVQMAAKQDSSILFSTVLDEFSSVDSFAAMLHGGRKIFPFLYGETYLDVALFMVPRSIWPDKPAAFSRAVGEYVTSDENDVPPGVIGELYINFHVFGIVGGMFLLGCLMALIYQRTIVDGAGSRAMYAVFLPYFGVFLTRNFVGGGILLLCSILPMWPAIRYIRKPPRVACDTYQIRDCFLRKRT